MIFLTVGRKPMSSMRSASSRTSMKTPCRSKSWRPRKSTSLPGVAMSACAPSRIDCSCLRSLIPPTATAARIAVPAAIFAKVSWICSASSRVGLRMTARIPEGDGCPSRRWITGRTNANVLPVPVWAVATRSRPANAGGMDWACTGVGWAKPCLARLLFSGAERESSEKFII